MTLSDKKAIAAARKAYDKLTAKQKKQISASLLKKLTNAEDALKKLEEDPVTVKEGKLQADGVYNVANVELAEGYKMFNVVACELTVKDGKMTMHISLQSKKIVNLFYGLAEDAQKDGAELIEPTTDEVTYSDGYVEEVYGFDIPVPALDEEFDVALIGTHGNWYDHKVKVSNPVEGDDIHAGSAIDLEDGDYQVDVAKEGGTGKAEIESPAPLKVADGKATLTVKWSSPHYDYMLVDGEKYEPVNKDELASADEDSGIGSIFEIPVTVMNEPFTVVADTTAMSEPHEIEYKLTCTLVEE